MNQIVPPDRMTTTERLSALKNGEKPDRVPFFSSVGGYAARISGLSLKEYYTNVEACLEAQLWARELHGYDDTPGFGWGDWGGWEFGGVLQFPETDEGWTPRTLHPPVQKPSDVDRLAIPDPRKTGLLKLARDFNRLLTARGYSAKIKLGSPTTLVASMIGPSRLMTWFIREPEAVRTAYDKAVALIIRAAEATLADFGPNCSAGISAPLDSNELIGPRIFETFAWPPLKRICDWLTDRHVTRLHIHLCGDHRLNLPAWTALPWPRRTSVSIGRMDMEKAALAFGDDFIITGNLSTTLLATGRPDEVLAAAGKCIEIGKHFPGGYALMPECEMPVFTPPINILAMLKATRIYGQYD
jgi:uroporphyrinogen decarboxylase